MEHFITLITSADSPVLVVILSLVLVFIFIKEIYSAVKWILDRLNGYHKIKNTEEDKDSKIEERFLILERHDQNHWNKLNEMGEEIKEIISMIKCVQNTQSKAIVNTYKDSIFRIYHESMKTKSISQAELDRFIDLVTVYRKAGGDGVVDEKIYPEILSLPIDKEE